MCIYTLGAAIATPLLAFGLLFTCLAVRLSSRELRVELRKYDYDRV